MTEDQEQSAPGGRAGDPNAHGASGVAPSVVVVGAGIAGLGAAWSLRRAGYRVAVIERRSQAGGRRRSERVEGFQLERSLDLLRTDDAELVSWIRDGGAGDDLLPLRPVLPSLATAGGEPRSVDASSLLGLSRLEGVGLLGVRKALRLPRLMRRYRPLLDRARPERAASLDFRSCADFARLYLGEPLHQSFVAPLVAGRALGDPEELSRVAFLLEYERSLTGREAIARRGLSQALQAAAEKCEVALRVEATAIASDERGVAVRVVRTKGDVREERTVRADAVVLATGPDDASSLLGSEASPAERDLLSGVAMRPTALLAIALERATVGAPQLVRVPAASSSPLQEVLVEPGGPDGRAPNGFGVATAVATLHFAESAQGANDEVVEKELLAAFERVLPRAPVRFARLARGAAEVPAFDVGAYRALERFRRVQRDRRAQGRRIYFAGDWLGGVGAAEALATGVRAAQQLQGDVRPNA